MREKGVFCFFGGLATGVLGAIAACGEAERLRFVAVVDGPAGEESLSEEVEVVDEEELDAALVAIDFFGELGFKVVLESVDSLRPFASGWDTSTDGFGAFNDCFVVFGATGSEGTESLLDELSFDEDSDDESEGLVALAAAFFSCFPSTLRAFASAFKDLDLDSALRCFASASAGGSITSCVVTAFFGASALPLAPSDFVIFF